ncbi:MAG: peptide ABC transporter substrate-binding protein [Simkaniaceae bacterium]|nr:peptide ABC transporter substrate-binding protein [Simkaniaceae bacterium]
MKKQLMTHWVALFILSICCLMTPGCSKKPKAEEKERPFRINLTSSPSTFDPRRAGDMTSATLQFFLSEGLTRMLPGKTAALGLADHIEISKDKCIYTFHLRDAYWPDRQPITARDFELSWKSILSPSFPSSNAFLLYPILNAKEAKEGLIPLDQVGVRSIDENTLRVTLKHPAPFFLEITSFCTLFPIPSHLENQLDEVFYLPTGCPCIGPYTIQSYQPGSCLELVKNPIYWEKEKVLLNRISISLIEDPLTAYEMYQLKQLDLIGTPFTTLPIDVIEHIKGEHHLHFQPLAGTHYLSINTQSPLLNHWHFRKAIFYAIDRDQLVTGIGLDPQTIALGIIPPILGGKCNTESELINHHDTYEHRCLLAQKHLALALDELKIQMSDLKVLNLSYSTDQLSYKVACILQEQLKNALKINIQLAPNEPKLLINNLAHRQYDLALTFCFAQYFDAVNLLERFAYRDNPKNYPGWESEEFIALLNRSMFEYHFAQRQQLLNDAEAILLKETAIIPLFHPTAQFIVQPYIQNLKTNPTGGFYFNEIISTL